MGVCLLLFFFLLLLLLLFCDPLIMNSHQDCSWSIWVRRADNKDLWVWYSHNIPPMIKILHQNMTQRGTQATGLCVMTGRCSPDSQYRRPDRLPAIVGCSFFRYTNDDLRNHTNQRRKHKTWTRENNQLALHCYFTSNLSHRGYKKRMVEIWQECARFQTTSQRVADQVRATMKKVWFFDREILEIHQKINNEHNSNIVPDT